MEWQPIETAPESITLVDVLLADEYGVCIGYRSLPVPTTGGFYWWAEGGQVTIKPTHWMPLPDLPK